MCELESRGAKESGNRSGMLEGGGDPLAGPSTQGRDGSDLEEEHAVDVIDATSPD